MVSTRRLHNLSTHSAPGPCSPGECLEKRVFASLQFFVDRVRFGDLGYNSPSAPREVWIRSSVNHYAAKTINIEKSFGEFLGEVGGSLGLLVGASVLTLFEFGELVIRLAAHVYSGHRGAYTLPK